VFRGRGVCRRGPLPVDGTNLSKVENVKTNRFTKRMIGGVSKINRTANRVEEESQAGWASGRRGPRINSSSYHVKKEDCSSGKKVRKMGLIFPSTGGREKRGGLTSSLDL